MLPSLKLLEYLCYLLIFILLFKLSEAIPVDGNIVEEPSAVKTELNKRDSIKRAIADCDTKLSWICIKVEFLKFMERLAEQEEFKLLPGISVVKDQNATNLKSSDIMTEVARNYPNDPSSRLNGYIITKLSNFLQNHYLRLKLIDSTTITEARSVIDSVRGRKSKFGKKGGLETLIAAGLMMKGTLLAIGMGAIALTAGKALMTALMALTLSGVLGLKSLASSGGKSTTYEIVAKPVYTSSHSHSLSSVDAAGHYSGGFGHSGGGGYSSGGSKRSLEIN